MSQVDKFLSTLPGPVCRLLRIGPSHPGVPAYVKRRFRAVRHRLPEGVARAIAGGEGAVKVAEAADTTVAGDGTAVRAFALSRDYCDLLSLAAEYADHSGEVVPSQRVMPNIEKKRLWENLLPVVEALTPTLGNGFLTPVADPRLVSVSFMSTWNQDSSGIAPKNAVGTLADHHLSMVVALDDGFEGGDVFIICHKKSALRPSVGMALTLRQGYAAIVPSQFGWGLLGLQDGKRSVMLIKIPLCWC